MEEPLFRRTEDLGFMLNNLEAGKSFDSSPSLLCALRLRDLNTFWTLVDVVSRDRC